VLDKIHLPDPCSEASHLHVLWHDGVVRDIFFAFREELHQSKVPAAQLRRIRDFQSALLDWREAVIKEDKRSWPLFEKSWLKVEGWTWCSERIALLREEKRTFSSGALECPPNAPLIIKKDPEWASLSLELLSSREGALRVPIALVEGSTRKALVATFSAQKLSFTKGCFRHPGDWWLDVNGKGPTKDFAKTIENAWRRAALAASEECSEPVSGVAWRVLVRTQARSHVEPSLEDAAFEQGAPSCVSRLEGRSAGGSAAYAFYHLITETKVDPSIVVCANLCANPHDGYELEALSDGGRDGCLREKTSALLGQFQALEVRVASVSDMNIVRDTMKAARGASRFLRVGLLAAPTIKALVHHRRRPSELLCRPFQLFLHRHYGKLAAVILATLSVLAFLFVTEREKKIRRESSSKTHARLFKALTESLDRKEANTQTDFRDALERELFLKPGSSVQSAASVYYFGDYRTVTNVLFLSDVIRLARDAKSLGADENQRVEAFLALNVLGKSYKRLGDFGEALKCFTLARELGDNHPLLLLEMAETQLALEKRTAAKETLDALINGYLSYDIKSGLAYRAYVVEGLISRSREYTIDHEYGMAIDLLSEVRNRCRTAITQIGEAHTGNLLNFEKQFENTIGGPIIYDESQDFSILKIEIEDESGPVPVRPMINMSDGRGIANSEITWAALLAQADVLLATSLRSINASGQALAVADEAERILALLERNPSRPWAKIVMLDVKLQKAESLFETGRFVAAYNVLEECLQTTKEARATLFRFSTMDATNGIAPPVGDLDIQEAAASLVGREPLLLLLSGELSLLTGRFAEAQKLQPGGAPEISTPISTNLSPTFDSMLAWCNFSIGQLVQSISAWQSAEWVEDGGRKASYAWYLSTNFPWLQNPPGPLKESFQEPVAVGHLDLLYQLASGLRDQGHLTNALTVVDYAIRFAAGQPQSARISARILSLLRERFWFLIELGKPDIASQTLSNIAVYLKQHKGAFLSASPDLLLGVAVCFGSGGEKEEVKKLVQLVLSSEGILERLSADSHLKRNWDATFRVVLKEAEDEKRDAVAQKLQHGFLAVKMAISAEVFKARAFSAVPICGLFCVLYLGARSLKLFLLRQRSEGRTRISHDMAPSLR
jgi:tetratricopeptide (TPR) repeat protein